MLQPGYCVLPQQHVITRGTKSAPGDPVRETWPPSGLTYCAVVVGGTQDIVLHMQLLGLQSNLCCLDNLRLGLCSHMLCFEMYNKNVANQGPEGRALHSLMTVLIT